MAGFFALSSMWFYFNWKHERLPNLPVLTNAELVQIIYGVDCYLEQIKTLIPYLHVRNHNIGYDPYIFVQTFGVYRGALTQYRNWRLRRLQMLDLLFIEAKYIVRQINELPYDNNEIIFSYTHGEMGTDFMVVFIDEKYLPLADFTATFARIPLLKLTTKTLDDLPRIPFFDWS